MTGLTIDIENPKVLDALNELAQRCQHLMPVMDSIGAKLEKQVEQRFDLKVDPNGHPWASWKPSTAKFHAKNGKNGGSLLEMERYMLQSLSHQADDNSVEVGFGMPYAVFHEFGTKNMARRGMLTSDPEAGILSDEDCDLILDILKNRLADALK